MRCVRNRKIKMLFDYRQIFQKLILSLFLVMSCAALFSGVALMTMKSPTYKAEIYLAKAVYDKYDAQGLDMATQENLLQHSQKMTLQALSLTPYDDALWSQLTTLREERHNLRQQDRDNNIALSDLK